MHGMCHKPAKFDEHGQPWQGWLAATHDMSMGPSIGIDTRLAHHRRHTTADSKGGEESISLCLRHRVEDECDEPFLPKCQKETGDPEGLNAQ
jgi:hypothetical protein